MNGPLYWKGQLPVILLQLAAMVGLALLLLLGGMNGDSVALILLLWALVAALWLVRGYVLRKRQLEALLERGPPAAGGLPAGGSDARAHPGG